VHNVRDRTGGASLTIGCVTLGATGGMRRADDERVDFGGGRIGIALSSTTTFEVAGGTYPSDRFTGAAGGRYTSAGLQVRFGGSRSVAGSTRPSVRPSGVSAPARGFTRLAIEARDASRVEVMGDWNSWKPVAAKRAANGVWYADVRLAPGEYRYAFRVDGNEWRVPRGTAAVDDGFGGKSAYITVRDSKPTK
jgi:hypothetical protein